MTDIVNGLLVRDQKVLMAHRSPSRKNYPGTWCFPGGHVEDSETLEDALRRELSEEIGVFANSWSFIRQFNDPTSNPDKPVTFHFFVVDDWQGEPINIGDEHTQIRWVKLVDAAQMEDLTFSAYVDLFTMLASN
ncbi:MAG: NUDIX hydrolase [Alphaproteobacteria bacterium MedPE-SWcel]|nr:MAG: NUDIX hydrolase [Alphaproteobacteria bacterium MedPE-SWcel]